MGNPFFEQPILNSPYDYPARHWELDDHGQPTQKLLDNRRPADFITPIPKARKRSGQQELSLRDEKGISSAEQRYHSAVINGVREHVDRWRRIDNPAKWGVSPETARLLQHWRHHEFSNLRPFFCQIEAVETAIWLTEVAPKLGKAGASVLEHLAKASEDANPGLDRLALKMATGAGKTTVMAMLIAWQTINAVRHPGSKRFTRGFLVVAPGITIRDRLQVLLPNDPNAYYRSRELVPTDMLADVDRAKIVITNYHAFKLRERMSLSKGNRRLLEGRHGDEVATLETEGQMIQRVMPELMGMRNIMVINDEAHHCYREKPASDEDFTDDHGNPLKGTELNQAKKAAEESNQAARLWISGLEAVTRSLGLTRVMDLSATPFFLSGSGYVEGTLFPWTMSDFSLMDAIECGIVKLPRVPVADNIPDASEKMPRYRELWKHVRKGLPKSNRGKKKLDPLDLPVDLVAAMDALYDHYAKTFEAWDAKNTRVPPCFIVVCQNTAISKLVYDYISGFEHEANEDGSIPPPFEGKLPLFSNYDEHGNRRARPRTLLIDSRQLESGEGMDNAFRKAAGDEIEQFKREVIERKGRQDAAEGLTDQDLLREVMNTVGKPGHLGESIRCVVSVSMLTEGWDANTVTHVLGVRAFGTQLLCEQVIGRALRRRSYDLNEDGLFNVEYADVLGIPFDFTAKPVVAPPQPPRETIHVRAVHPERDALEIRFPRVQGYRIELPEERLTAEFDEASKLRLTPDLVSATKTHNAGIIGEGVELTPQYLGGIRKSTLVFHLTQRLLTTKWRDPNEQVKMHLFGQLKRITKRWLDTCLECSGGTYPAQLMYQQLSDLACNKITAAITETERRQNQRQVKAILDSYSPVGSTREVNFNTSKDSYWTTDARRCHINYAMLDSEWEAQFCRVAEAHPRVRSYVKNHNLGLEVPYRMGSENRRYIPDFIVQVDDGHGDDDPLNLIVEIKGYRREDAVEKKSTMDRYWIPGVNHLGNHGRWAFAEFRDVFSMDEEFEKKIEAQFKEMLDAVHAPPVAEVDDGH